MSPCFAESISKARPSEHSETSVKPPNFFGGAPPKYPDGESRPAKVTLKLLVGTDGTVDAVKVVQGEEPFRSLAERAARSFVFEPALRGEKAVASFILFEVPFLPPKPALPIQVAVLRPSSQLESEKRPVSVSVMGERKPIASRSISDAETLIIPGAEGDPVRAIQALPGAVPVLMSGPFIGIRGAPPGLIGSSFDQIELPYLFHLARGTAVVHPWLVDSARLYGAGRPGSLGRAIGGQIEATSAGPAGRVRAGGRLRLTEAALGAEIPFAEGRGSVLMAGRYSYTAPLVSAIAPSFALDYWDYQGRVRYSLNPTDTLELTSFGARDMSGRKAPDGTLEELFDATFHRAALRFARLRANGSALRFGVVYGHDSWDANQSQARPWSDTLKVQAEWKVPVDTHNRITIGFDAGLRNQHDSFFAAGGAPTSFRRMDTGSAIWFTWSYRPSHRMELDLGLRADWFTSGDSPITEGAFHAALGPHLLFSHELNRVIRFHTSFSAGGAPPSPGQRPPSRTYSIAHGLAYGLLSDAGVEFNWPDLFRVDVSVFQNAFLNTADVNTLLNLEGQDPMALGSPGLARGQGQSYGLEVSLRRTFAKRVNGFVSYAVGRSWRSIGRVRGPAEFDRTHVFDASLGYDFGSGWLASMRGSVFSGYPARASSVALAVDPPRTTPYYQIDIQIARRFKLGEHGSIGFTVGVLNTTLNQETNDMFCNQDVCEESRVGPATIPTIGVDGEI